VCGHDDGSTADITTHQHNDEGGVGSHLTGADRASSQLAEADRGDNHITGANGGGVKPIGDNGEFGPLQ